MSVFHSPMFDQYLGAGKPSGGDGEFRYVCPFCRESDPSLAVNYIRKRFICFRASCGVKGHLSYLATKLGFTYDDIPVLSSIDQMRHRLWAVDDGSWEMAPKLEEPVVVPELKQIEPGTRAWQYLTDDRGLTPHDIYYNELSLSPEDRGRRIYFPQRDETGRIVFWVARKYLPGHRTGRKYVNPGGSIKKRLLYRSHLVDRNYPVSVCEGPLSAIAAGNAVATLGVMFSKEQVAAIAGLGCPILSAMDGEAFTESIKLARRLEPYGVLAGVVPLPRGVDPADVTRAYGRQGYDYYARQAFTLEPGAIAEVRERLSRVW